jgi:hypothetical protein
MDFPVSSSTLTWQPYRHWLTGELDGEVTLWQVCVDGKPFASSMQPFSAADAEIERYACLSCGFPGCGGGWITVRRFGSYVVWFRPPVELNDFHSQAPGLNSGEVLVFDATQYVATMGDSQSQHLPSLSVHELKVLLLSELPEPTLALYCLPEISNDPRGQKVLQRSQVAFNQQVQTIEVAYEPKSWVEIHLGLDIEGVPECIWQVSFEPEPRVKFLAKPSLPIWLKGEAIAAIFASAVFAFNC